MYSLLGDLADASDNEFPMEPLCFPAVVIGADELPPMAGGSTDGQICAAEGGVAGERDVEPHASDQSIHPKAPGWTRRVRIGAAAPGRTPNPGRSSALWKANRGFAEKPGEIVIVPAIGTSFDTLGEAYDFHNIHSWEKAFGIRHGKSRLNVERTKCMEVCVCAGKPGVEDT
ncbi:uncharacterized protein [Triticum aestivum]|uniref:uncharacterized protein n=1 Tax=Triticum aestivum TaxID=4565 RepID=UPI001D01C7AA|nr:uncharacterized protein LOC123107589 [Triticum aestivum]